MKDKTLIILVSLMVLHGSYLFGQYTVCKEAEKYSKDFQLNWCETL